MSKSDTFENDFLKLIFQAVAIANLADNAAGSPLANLYVALHTADPGESGTQSTSEISYTGYARVAVVRTASGWAVAANVGSPVSAITFGKMTGGAGGTATYFSIGVAVSGATKILWSGPITPSIVVALNVTPQLDTATTVTED